MFRVKNATHNNLTSQFRGRIADGNGAPKPRSRFQPNSFGEDRSCQTCEYAGVCEIQRLSGHAVLACKQWRERNPAPLRERLPEWWEKSDGGRALKQLSEDTVKEIARKYYRDGLTKMALCIKHHYGIVCLLRNCAKYGIELKQGITWDEAKRRWGL